jgi:asparagine synthase (glutamine-hydrolysing)
MCGINGIVTSRFSFQQKEEMMRRMNTAIVHRGPNHTGIAHHEQVSLGHTRLSIIDLSEESNQPFYSHDKQHVIVFNGEVYNYRELKLELQRVSQGSSNQPYFFKTASDTEVVLAAYLRWGAACVNYLQGMFAFAILNTHTKHLFIARDRMGVKPLYYHYSDNGLVFSSELRAILQSGITRFSLNKDVLEEYIQYQTINAPNTIVKGIRVLMPGHSMQVEGDKVNTTCYWKLEDFVKQTTELSYEATCSKINELLTYSVQKRLMSDVPFGAFLSGGIDSSIVVGLMAKVSTEPIETFNVSFDESEFSESVYAREIAKRFNTKHHEIRLTPADFLRDLPQALAVMDHPGGDGINTYIVSKATKQAGISMALSGIGGDELFAGYPNFKRLYHLQHNWKLKLMPTLLRKSAGHVLSLFANSVSRSKIAELLMQEVCTINTAYPFGRSVFNKTELEQLLGKERGLTAIHQLAKEMGVKSDYILSTISMLEMKSYLPDVLLRDTDQMAMAVALEVREPFLDHHLVEFVLGVKDDYKYPHAPKKLLRDSVGDLIPDSIVNRPKMGFVLPWEVWMRNDLKVFCEQQLNELEKKGLFKSGSLYQLWQRFLNGDKQITWSRLWHLIVLNNWINVNEIET